MFSSFSPPPASSLHLYSLLPPNRKFYYITLLRDPVSRYLSEWRHVQRGATWKTSLHMCDGRTPTPEELPSCYEGSDWSGCTLQQFMDCPYNLANNRQVRRCTGETGRGKLQGTECVAQSADGGQGTGLGIYALVCYTAQTQKQQILDTHQQFTSSIWLEITNTRNSAEKLYIMLFYFF